MEPRRGSNGDTVEYSNCRRDARNGRRRCSSSMLVDARDTNVSYHGLAIVSENDSCVLGIRHDAREKKGEREREEGITSRKRGARSQDSVGKPCWKQVKPEKNDEEGCRREEGADATRSEFRNGKCDRGVKKRKRERERLPELLCASARKWERMARSASLLRHKDETVSESKEVEERGMLKQGWEKGE